MRVQKRAYRYGGVLAVVGGKRVGAGWWPQGRSTNGIFAR
jgi:hypothetical protein